MADTPAPHSNCELKYDKPTRTIEHIGECKDTPAATLPLPPGKPFQCMNDDCMARFTIERAKELRYACPVCGKDDLRIEV